MRSISRGSSPRSSTDRLPRRFSTHMKSSARRSCAGWSRSRAGLGRSSCRRTGRSPPRATRFSPASILSRRFRAFIGRGGVVPPPAIHRSALTASGKDALIGQMAPQPTVKSSREGDAARPVPRLPSVACAWIRRRSRVDAVRQRPRDPRGAGRALHCSQPLGPSRAGEHSVLQCSDPKFIAWARKHGVRAVLVRPDRFIAARLDASADLAVLNPFAMATAAALPQAA